MVLLCTSDCDSQVTPKGETKRTQEREVITLPADMQSEHRRAKEREREANAVMIEVHVMVHI